MIYFSTRLTHVCMDQKDNDAMQFLGIIIVRQRLFLVLYEADIVYPELSK